MTKIQWINIYPELRKFILNSFGISISNMSLDESTGDLHIKTMTGYRYRLGYFMDNGTFAHENPAYRCKDKMIESDVQYDYFVTFHNGELMFSSNVDSNLFQRAELRKV